MSLHPALSRCACTLLALVTLLVTAGLVALPAPPAQAQTVLCSGVSQAQVAACDTSGYANAMYQAHWGMFAGHNCTNYVAYRMQQNGVARPGRQMGNAHEWAGNARALGILVNTTPAVGALGVWPGRQHIVYVEEVGPGYLVISEDNYPGNYGSGANWPNGMYRKMRVVPGDRAYPAEFIHFKDLGGSTPQPSGNPVGSFDVGQGMTRGAVRVAGWSYDPDERTAPVEIHVYVDGPAGVGTGHSLGPAQMPRDDVAAAFPGVGAAHGFHGVIAGLGAGAHPVYVYAINRGTSGGNVLLGQRTVVVPETQAGSPEGSLDMTEGMPGSGVRLGGWVLDRDAFTSPADIHVYLDGPAGSAEGRFVHASTARIAREDVARAFPGAGARHGFDVVVRNVSPGWHTAFVYGINRAGGGENPLIGERPFFVASGPPIGNFENARGLFAGKAQVAGWTLDPDAPLRTTQIHVYADGPAGTGTFVGAADADLARGDVGAAMPTAGPHHGFETVVDLSPGNHALYVYAINAAGSGDNPLLGRRDVSVPAPSGGSPVGSFDTATDGQGALTLRGWSFDPDAPGAATAVHAYLDGPAGLGGRFVDLGAAGVVRSDVAAVHPQAGARHGFDRRLRDLAPGVHTVYVYAINRAGGGDHPLLGFRKVRVTPDRTAPAVRIVRPTRARTRSRRIDVQWVATDSASSTVATELRYRSRRGSGRWTSWRQPAGWRALDDRASLTGAARNTTYCFSVRSRDRVGNRSAWTRAVCVRRTR